MKTQVFLLSLLSIFVLDINAQTPSWLWAKKAGGINDDKGQSICTDAIGNVLVTGNFASSTITFGSITLTNPGMFIVKYNNSGNVLWAKDVGGNIGANSITTDPLGNIYVTGYFNSTSITFGSNTLTNSNNYGNIFVVKYDTSGNVVWAKNTTKFGTSATIVGNCISVDANNNVFVTGYFTANISLGNYIRFDGVGDFSSKNGSQDFFAVKYDASGNPLWVSKSGGSYGEEGFGITTDANGNVLVTGYFQSDSIVFGNTTLNNAGGSACGVSGCKDFFLVKYNSGGNVVWADRAGSYNNDDLGWSLSTDINGNSYIIGQSDSYSIIFDSLTLTNNLSRYFVVKYDSSGNARWVNGASGTIYSSMGIVSTDIKSNIYVTGSFNSPTVTFGNEILTNYNGGNNTYDIFIVKYDIIGNVVWAKSVGYNNDDWGQGISVDTSGNVFVTGYFQSYLLAFDNNYVFNADNSGTSDLFVAKLCQLPTPLIAESGPTTFCQGDSVILTASTETSYLWSNGATTKSIAISTSGNYSVTVTNTNGCSANSVITNVTVNPLPIATITGSGAVTFCQGGNITLTSSSGDSYLWSTNDTAQSILVNQSGSYSVIISNSCGTDTSLPTIVTAIPLPTATITPSGATVFCQGDSVTLTANSATSYLWSNSATTQYISVSTSANYSLTVTDSNGCSAISSALTVTANSLPQIPIITSNGTTLTSSSITGNQWYFNGNIINGATSQNYIVTQNGNYTVLVTDINGCSATSAPYNFTTVGIKDLMANNSIIIIPNPNNGKFLIETVNLRMTKIKIYNFIGEIVYQSEIKSSEIDLSTQPKGFYFIHIQSEEKQYNKKLIIY